MNNKGFIVSTILYTILIAFLLFLGVTLSIFASATKTAGAGTNDLVNSTKLSINYIVLPCNMTNWYDNKYNILAIVNSRYGEFYWPRDFGTSIDSGVIKGNNKKGNLEIKCSEDDLDDYNAIYHLESCNIDLDDYTDKSKKFYLYVVDTYSKSFAKTIYANNCK